MSDEGTAVNPNADGTYTIKGDRPLQMRRIVADHNMFLSTHERTLLEDDHDESVGRKLHELGRGQEQLLIIAAEIEREPGADILASRIYGYLKGWLNQDGISVPGYVYNAIHDILTDPYRHLTDEQRYEVFRMTAQIMAAGNGDDITMSVDQARETIKQANWTVQQMLEWCQLEEDGLRQRLDFDPDTGKPWED